MFNKLNVVFKKDRSSVMKGSIWTFAGFGSEMLFRMGSSLILTRIFLPEVFGLMAIVTSIMIGMTMISDVGTRISLIQNPNAKTAKFAQTAWTVQVIKGFILWFIVFIFAGNLANYFQEPLLIELLPVAALVLIFQGFISSNKHLYSRDLGVGKIVLAKIFVQFISISLVIIFSIIYESIWVIIAGALLTSLLDILFSFTLFKHFPMRFRLDMYVLQTIFKLGKWLFLATFFHFLIAQGDRLILGGLIDKTELGLYNLAAMFTQIPISILGALSGNILLPFLAKSFNDKPENFDQIFNELLQKILKYMLPLIATLAVLGDSLIQLLYPSDFHLAGQILQLLAIASLFQVISFALIPVFLSRGDSFRHMLAYLSLLTLYLPGIFLGFKFYGMWGAFYGMFTAQILWLPIIIILVQSYVRLNLVKVAKNLGAYFVITLVAITIIN
jgi:O-antigen/teichoic acid export membrane protein